MAMFPTNSAKTNVSDLQEVMSSDLVAVSNNLHQILKDRNTSFFVNQLSGYAPGCILTGWVPTFQNFGTGLFLILMSEGSGIFNTATDPKNYSGSLVTTGPSTVFSDPTVGNPRFSYSPAGTYTQYAIDVAYSETTSTGASRTFYRAPSDTTYQASPYTRIAPAGGINVYTPAFIAKKGPAATSLSQVSVPDPDNGYSRVFTFVVSSSAVVSGPNYTMPYIWELQEWPGGSRATASANTHCLASALSAIRAQLNDILESNAQSSTRKWYDTPPIDLATVSSRITSLQSRISAVVTDAGFKSMSVFTFSTSHNQTGDNTFLVPIGCTKMYFKLWGPGGNGGSGFCKAGSPNFYAWGGGGGSGAYVEDVMSVTPGQQIPCFVYLGGSGAATVLGSYSAGAGQNGGDSSDNSYTVPGQAPTWPHDGIGGLGGVAVAPSGNTTALCINGAPGSTLGYGEGKGAHQMPCITKFTLDGQMTSPPLWGCGGGGGMGLVDSGSSRFSGGTGGDGLAIVYFA